MRLGSEYSPLDSKPRELAERSLGIKHIKKETALWAVSYSFGNVRVIFVPVPGSLSREIWAL